MPDTGTVGKTSLGLRGASTISGAYARYLQGGAESRALKYSATLNDFNAKSAEASAADAARRGNKAQKRHKKDVAAFLGYQKAAYGASGVDVGSGAPQTVIMDSALEADAEAAIIRSNSNLEVYGSRIEAVNFRTQARLNRLEAKNAVTAGKIGAFNTFLTGGTKLTSSYLDLKKSGVI